MPKPTPHGEWPSPIDAETVAADAVEFGGVAVDNGTVYWLERRPDEGGRGVVMRQALDEPAEAVTPADVDVRTTVHEYGGGDFAVRDGTVVFSRFDDQRLLRTDGDDVEPVVPEPPDPSAHRYADVAFVPGEERIYCVRERHPVQEGDADEGEERAGDDAGSAGDDAGSAGDDAEISDDESAEPANELVAISLADEAAPTVVEEGHDFYSFPSVAPDGDRLVWTTWDHPRMPWDGTELHVADVADDGTLTNERTVMGGPEESVFQPSWAPDGTLYAVSDRTGWWNVYRNVADDPTVVRQEAAEFGTPQWVFGLATYQPMADGDLVAVRNSDGSHQLGTLDPETGAYDPAELGFSAYPHTRMATDGETVATVAAGPTTPPSVVRWRPGESPTSLRRSVDVAVDDAYLSEPTHETFPTEDGSEEAHALYYPPRNPDVEAPDDEAPPLVVSVHGGPTSQVLPVLDLETQFFTSRGFGVVDVNYRGGTGYGRAYRDRLDGEWGVVDVADCVAAAEHLVDTDRADPDRLAVRGGSAGGYATLRALTARDTFDAGASYYGVADLRALAENTHKFESRYLEGLVGPLPEAAETFRERSPVDDADAIHAPLLVLQGGEDRVVPEAQAEEMVEALVETGTPYAYVSFPAERHGFRTADARETALATEYAFYAAAFDLEPAAVDESALSLTAGRYRKRTVGGDD